MNQDRILIVDDEPANRRTLIRQLDEQPLLFLEAGNGREALAQLEQATPDLILLDLCMPEMDGFAFLRALASRPEPRKIPVCVMTGLDDADTRRKSIQLGADDFISKPFDPVELETRITSLLRISRYQRDLHHLNSTLENRVRQRTHTLQIAVEELEHTREANARAYREMLERISELVALNPGTGARTACRAGHYAAALARHLHLDDDTCNNIALAGQLHDLGLLALPEKLRHTPPARFSAEEKILYYNHTRLGARLFDDSDTPLLRLAHDICACHHEHFDGSGLPNGLRGPRIPLEARLFSLALFLAEKCPEGSAPTDELRQHLQHDAGRQFDPELVALLLQDDRLHRLLQNQNAGAAP